jgi:hypothetical protein
MKAKIAALLLLLAVAGCSPIFQGRIVDELAEAGVPRPIAECMAERWVERLSIFQLRKLQRYAQDVKAEQGAISVLGLASRVQQIDDPEIVSVVTSSAFNCSLKRV